MQFYSTVELWLNFGNSRLQSPWYSISCQWKMQWTCIPNNFLFLFLVILLYLWISQGFSWHLKSNLIKPAKFDCIWIVNIKGHSTLIWINALNVLKDSEIHQTVVHVTTKLLVLWVMVSENFALFGLSSLISKKCFVLINSKSRVNWHQNDNIVSHFLTRINTSKHLLGN